MKTASLDKGEPAIPPSSLPCALPMQASGDGEGREMLPVGPNPDVTVGPSAQSPSGYVAST
jgi:hypothetical protein